ncbi:TolC family protein [Adhaeribacter rhizoryzae]|uniref:TolC family protein n=1 Tax=Adhaeribacter rhizoryzae TaxID=2607907 RepID=A0A5M6DAB7_9BACT|nr:TolC family protein [Adhaeribacter rhizoryzae]KAA5542929.1 TolC family protein [Adhaeribacter rhizoryzae]
MFKRLSIRSSLTFIFILLAYFAQGQNQVLTMTEALQTALTNYGTLKAKANYTQASQAAVRQSQRDYLPNFSVSGQHDYGTINGQNGAFYGFRGLNSSSSGPAMETQNWNAAFGALYLANVNWDFFSFGQAREKIQVAKAVNNQDQADLVQEQFQHQVRVAGAYLNLQAAQRLTRSQERNLERAVALKRVVVARAKNGLNPGVDSSLAIAEVSNAKIALTRAVDTEQEQANQLAQLLGVAPQPFVLDSLFFTRVPVAFAAATTNPADNHPVLSFYRQRLNLSRQREKYFRTFNYPTFSVFSVLQARGSGFSHDYNINPEAYTKSFRQGITPTRGNYLFGVGMVWNLTDNLRVQQQVQAQQYTSRGLQNEYNLVNQQLTAQLSLAETKIQNALSNYREAPNQIQAASNAYTQKNALYRNGLATIVDITQALYTLNRAEIDRDIAHSNVWQALLFKAAAAGDISLFTNEF